MRSNPFERNYRDTPALNGVQMREFSNKTKIARTQGKISLNCDHCGLPYETYACWAKRVSNHYCSRACSSAAQEIKIEKECVICGSKFITIPANIKRIVTCSHACLREKKSKFIKSQVTKIEESRFFNYGKFRRGADVGNAKLDESKVRAIRNDTRPQMVIANEYGICQSTVSLLKRKKTWGDVADVRKEGQ